MYIFPTNNSFYIDISKAEEKRNAVRLEELEADIIVLVN